MEKTGWFITRQFSATNGDGGRVDVFDYVYYVAKHETAKRICDLLYTKFEPGRLPSGEYLTMAAESMGDDEWLIARDEVSELAEQATRKPETPASERSAIGIHVACRRSHAMSEVSGEPAVPSEQSIELSPAFAEIERFAGDMKRLPEQTGACVEADQQAVVSPSNDDKGNPLPVDFRDGDWQPFTFFMDKFGIGKEKLRSAKNREKIKDSILFGGITHYRWSQVYERYPFDCDAPETGKGVL